MSLLAGLALAFWALIALLPWRPWATSERLEAGAAGATAPVFPEITVVIPARNEAEHIGETLAALGRQGRFARVVVVDDESTDGTGQQAAASAIPGLEVRAGRPLPEGWSGKLWALHQGTEDLGTAQVLLLDADVRLEPGIVAALAERARAGGLALASLMVLLAVHSAWDKLLLPAFIYFFKLLYPFRLANRPGGPIAAAAGGCILLRTEALQRIGGFAAIRGAIIDDCTLALAVKRSGGRCALWLTRSASSTRPYRRLQPIWDMVARSAYTQLRYSPALLAACTAVMLLAFAVPPAALAAGPARGAGAAAMAIMALTYLPTLRLYRLSPAWALGLPAAGLCFLAMTWASALRYWAGERSRWKARSYQRP